MRFVVLTILVEQQLVEMITSMLNDDFIYYIDVVELHKKIRVLEISMQVDSDEINSRFCGG